MKSSSNNKCSHALLTCTCNFISPTFSLPMYKTTTTCTAANTHTPHRSIKTSSSITSSLATLSKGTTFLCSRGSRVFKQLKSYCKRTRDSLSLAKDGDCKDEHVIGHDDLGAFFEKGGGKGEKELPAIPGGEGVNGVVYKRVGEEERAKNRERVWKDGGVEWNAGFGECEGGYAGREVGEWSLL